MSNFKEAFFDTIDTFLAWLSTGLKETNASYCDLETADDTYTLVAHDGSLVSLIEVKGITHLLGREEFDRLHEGVSLALRPSLKRFGHAIQCFFTYDKDAVQREIESILLPARETASRLELKLNDLLDEHVNYVSHYCGHEKMYFVLWTRPFVLSAEQRKQAVNDKLVAVRKNKIPSIKNAQDIVAAYPEMRDQHSSFVRSIFNDFETLSLDVKLLEVHDAVAAIRSSADSDFTAADWRAVLPGDKIPIRNMQRLSGELSGVLWPPLSKQILPRDAENLDLRTCRIGDKVYASLFIDLFPQEVKSFIHLFNRILPSQIPWRISFFLESDGLSSIKFKATVAAILSFASQQNRLLSDAKNALVYLDTNTDEAVVRLRVSLSTWAPVGSEEVLRTRLAELARAVEGWGSCEVSEISGDAFAGAVSSMLAVTTNTVATSSVAPLTDVVYMMPITRPSSPWTYGAVLLRSPDGKPWPYQPGSSQQTTWIDLFYARPGSGKSVLSNTINLGLCLAAGIKRLPHIAIIDIGPSSSGLVSLLQEALPSARKHEAAYYRLQMTPDYAINPFDTQLGCRHPTAQERSFLVNFLTLLATPLGSLKPYDGITDMAGIVVDELYKNFSDEESPRVYTPGIETIVDGILAEIGFVRDEHTTWWEVTDALFVAGFVHEATLAQRYAMPLLPDVASICRAQAIEDLYGQVKAPTGESLVLTFSRMISSAVREYPILSWVTRFDIGDGRIVSLDLDEVAKSGGDAADRQTAVMYMLARYVLARHYYLTEDNVADMLEQYQSYHRERIIEIREDPKRLVYDEFHRTARAQAIREQVVTDMREGRKWNVQIALISQSLDDFDSVMVEFATSVFIMDAGPLSAIERSSEVFGLSETAKYALKTRVHGPRAGGSTFLAQFATKYGLNTQLLTNTIGPIELWALSTTAEDASLRNKLYKRLNPAEARRVLANLFPTGTVRPLIETRMSTMKEEKGFIEEVDSLSVIDQLVEEILAAYAKDPNAKHLG
ncbi:MAG: type IV secretion protein IcmB [Pseudomonadota bacterium]|nr:type IV secretion protein IcmB [Gammaproteobacteria bacterium]MBU1926653.1 type IV secretion protein IcmB [Gammaproteobacteria bacterium]MBU2546550.1 type IV secretion protein IcmB [Gammaproteobacteria bacterium]